jgi:hypothetical protein
LESSGDAVGDTVVQLARDPLASLVRLDSGRARNFSGTGSSDSLMMVVIRPRLRPLVLIGVAEISHLSQSFCR